MPLYSLWQANARGVPYDVHFWQAQSLQNIVYTTQTAYENVSSDDPFRLERLRHMAIMQAHATITASYENVQLKLVKDV